MSTTTAIRETVDALPLFSSHEHYFEIDASERLDVNTLIANSYLDVEWTFLEPGETRASRASFLSQLRAKSYLRWFTESIRRIYDMEENLTVENWDEYGRRIGERRREPGFLNAVYRDFCRYEAVVQDTYWNPGSIPQGMDHFFGGGEDKLSRVLREFSF